jgi:two-component system cell cycle response regulator
MDGPQAFPSPPIAGPDRLTFDSLTGLHNEHLFRLQLPMEFQRAREQENNGSLIVIRLDNILAINAQHGRSGGDEALRAVAHLLESARSSAGRQSHVAFKLSGPVFGYYIPQCGAPDARALAEEIRDKVTTTEQFISRISVSLGVVNLYEFFREEGTREEIAVRIEQTAFARLATAGRAGGNTICDASDVSQDALFSRPVVLIVEPEPQSIELLVHALEAAEFTVRVALDGESAVSFIQATPPAVIIAEAMTPQLNGFTVRDRMRANALWNAIPFILVSHKKTEEFIRKAVESKILHFLKKPLSITEVVGLVANLTRSAQS